MAVQYLRQSGSLALGSTKLAGRYAWLVAFPPLVVVLPIAIAFLATVLRLHGSGLGRLVAAAALI